jgi:hypothetical protein
MENLSSLSSGLPVRASAQHELADLETRLMAEFKTAASAVTKLFKLSGAKTALSHDQGYADALQDLLDALDEDPTLDARSWAIQKLMEATGQAKYSSRHSDKPIQPRPDSAKDAAERNNTASPDDIQPPSGLFTFDTSIHLPDAVPPAKRGDDDITLDLSRPGSKRRILAFDQHAGKRQKLDDDGDATVS